MHPLQMVISNPHIYYDQRPSRSNLLLSRLNRQQSMYHSNCDVQLLLQFLHEKPCTTHICHSCVHKYDVYIVLFFLRYLAHVYLSFIESVKMIQMNSAYIRKTLERGCKPVYLSTYTFLCQRLNTQAPYLI